MSKLLSEIREKVIFRRLQSNVSLILTCDIQAVDAHDGHVLAVTTVVLTPSTMLTVC